MIASSCAASLTGPAAPVKAGSAPAGLRGLGLEQARARPAASLLPDQLRLGAQALQIAFVLGHGVTSAVAMT